MISYFRINRRKTARIAKWTSWILFAVIAIVFLLVPLIFRSFQSVQRHFIFRNDGSKDRFYTYNNTEKYNLDGAYNHHISSTDLGIRLGVWQVIPVSLIPSVPRKGDDKTKKEWFLEQLGDARPVVLYCHGNKPSRATDHRVTLYKVLQSMNFHVIAFDYRGYADSSAVAPTENGVVQDTLGVVNWIRSHSKSSLYIWGHSLGTGIATKASRLLCDSSTCPDVLILESPFTSLEEEIKNTESTFIFRFLPWFEYMFITPLRSQGLVFDSKENILFVDCPVLILHSEDDAIIPFELGRKLFEIVLESRKNMGSNSVVQFVPFNRKFNYGHNYICKAPELPRIIRDFLKTANPNLQEKN